MWVERTLSLPCLALGGVVHLLVLCSGLAGEPECVSLTITQQPPQYQVVLEGCRAKFAVGVTGTSPYLYQWFRDGQPVDGATNSTYTPFALSADNGIKIYATISNACSAVTSLEAVIYIVLDHVPPTLLRARGDASLNHVIVAFATSGCGWEGRPGLDPFTAQDPYNYEISGGIIASNALLDSARNAVVLTTSDQTPDTLYTLTVNGVSDLAGNSVMNNSQTSFRSWVIQPGSNPPEVVPPPVNITRSGTNIMINWPEGSLLQHASYISGPWTSLLDAARPHTPKPFNNVRFYRALFDP